MFPQRWLPAAIGLFKEECTQENSLLTNSLKIVRGKVTEVYDDVFKFMYTPAGKNINNEKNRETIKKILQ